MPGPDDSTTNERTVPTAPGDTELVPSATFVLRVVQGPDLGLEVSVDGNRPGPVLIGQSSACDVRLSDRQVSRRHAALDLSERQLRIADLGTTNGTFVNGVRVVEAFLEGGASVRIGQTSLAVELVAPALRLALKSLGGFGRLLGASEAMRRLYPLCERLAASDIPVVIEGETGTGKEPLAESLHEMGPRSAGPFVVFDCTAVSPSLLESELFGHERGAFTGAVATHKGVLEQASGGSLLIDEIGDLEPSLQPKLLRVLERSEIRRVGGERTIAVDVRVLCATRRNLDREVQAGRFRDDLFHRLAVARIELPPLRRRRADIAPLARGFCRQLGAPEAALSEMLLRSWEDYGWPGNVRELRNAVARHVALGDLAGVEAALGAPAPSIPPADPSSAGVLERIVAMGLPFPTARRLAVEEFERRYVEKVLADHGGNVLRAAAASGVARRQLQRVKGRLNR